MSEYIVRMPSDMPYEIKAELNAWYVESEPIVRCRDCACAVVTHPRNPITGAPAGIEVWRCDYFWNADELCEVDPDGFCAWGKKKVDE
jgi:hypothetical protein